MKQLINSFMIGFLCLFISSYSFAKNSDAFVTIWKTTEANETITIEINSNYTYDYTIDWGDGTQDSNVTGDITHTYQNSGDHEVSITGIFPAFNRYIDYYWDSDYDSRINNRSKLIEVKQWGTQEWLTMENMFSSCSNLTEMDANPPNMEQVTDMVNMFEKATSFNQSLNNWDVSNVKNMQYMFYDASSFNQPLNNWDVSNVKNMEYMFDGATEFNQPLNNWDVSNVETMEFMFYDAISFNQPLNNWDTSNVSDMESMFDGATEFNQPINSWNTANVDDMLDMFNGATSFNQPLNEWNTSNVTDMGYMFYEASSFNQPLDSWNTSNVVYMDYMFYEASSFNQPLDNWNLSNVAYMNNMLDYSNVTLENYDLTLLGWEQSISTNNTPKNMTLGANGLTYCAEEARQSLIDNYGWTIEGDAKATICNETALPVTLASFTATESNNQAFLQWKTDTELNNKGFEVQYSIDGTTWEVLDFVNGNGTTTVQQNYDYIHATPVNGINYYRLRQIDYDSKDSFSDVAQLEFNTNNSVVAIYPNPASDIINIGTNQPYTIYNNMGQKILEGNEQTIDVSSLQSGQYIINIDGQIQKFTKL